MPERSFEAVVEEGAIRLPPGVKLAEHTRVRVVVIGGNGRPSASVPGPRLTNPADVADFTMSIEPDPNLARI